MTAEALAIIADDLTGAMDSSGYFAEKGLTTVVVLAPGYSSAADVVVLTTNSRADDAEVARDKVRQAVRRVEGRIIYKKIDSTLSGNIGVELEAAMEAMAWEKAIVAPAFPVVGRTTAGGFLLVDGVRVAETQFAHDPISPVKESHIPTLLEKATGRQVGLVSVEQIDAGPEAFYHRVSGMPQALIVCDVVAQSHLASIAQAASLARGRWLLSGSGGLARELHLLLGDVSRPSTPASGNTSSGPALVVVGSRNQVAATQLLRARDELGLPIVDLAVEELDGSGSRLGEVSRAVEQADRHLGQGKSVALTSTFSRYVPALKQAVAPGVAEAVGRLVATRRLAGLFLSGGDIAVEVCRRLSVSAIRVHGEVEPGVPAGEVVGGRAQGMRIVTKAGGFGSEAALMKSISYLE